VYFKIDEKMRLILMCLVFGASITQCLRVNTPITNQKPTTNYINSVKPSQLTNPHALALVQTNPRDQMPNFDVLCSNFFQHPTKVVSPCHPCGRVMFNDGR
jgi:hypothetical protein